MSRNYITERSVHFELGLSVAGHWVKGGVELPVKSLDPVPSLVSIAQKSVSSYTKVHLVR